MEYCYFDIKAWECLVCSFLNTRHYCICEYCHNEMLDWRLEDLNREFRIENKIEKIKSIFGRDKRILLPVLACSTFYHFMYNIDNLYPFTKISNGLSGIFLINNNCNNDIISEVYKSAKLKYPNLWIGVNINTNNIVEIVNFIKDHNPDGFWMNKSFVTEKDYQNIPLYLLNIFKKLNWYGLYFGGISAEEYPIIEDKIKCLNNASNYMDVIIESDISLIKKNDNKNVIALASGNTIKSINMFSDLINIFIFRNKFVDENNNYIIDKIAQLLIK